jgi:SAM-dependent methyltransferase
MTSWHEDDGFWSGVEPVLFTMERMGQAPADARALVTLLGLEPGARVLDLCCGPGRHAVELARRGMRVTGVDRTTRYLDQAARAARETGVDLALIQADMRSFVRPRGFDAALNLFTSFGYFEDPGEDEVVARNLLTSLEPGGRAVLDMYGKELLARDFRPRDWSRHGDVILVEERTVRPGWDWISSEWTVLDGSSRRSFRVEHRLYSGQELRALLLRAGFGSVDLYGSFEGAPYDHEATRLVAVATAAGSRAP